MTPLLIIPLLFALNWLPVAVQAPNRPVTQLEGTWREPLLAGEKPTSRLVVTIKGEEITVVWYNGVFRGSIETSSSDEHQLKYFMITRVPQEAGDHTATYNFRFIKQSNQLFLQIFPKHRLDSDSRRLETAPVTFYLETIQK